MGVAATVDLCVALLEGADRNDHPDAMPYFTGVVFDEDSPIYYPSQWKDYWVRTLGRRAVCSTSGTTRRARRSSRASATSTGGRPRCA